MRFLADGPDLPLGLLEARDRGEVIFFCGAGVSMPAGLPNFQKLALTALQRLGVPASAAAAAIMTRALSEKDPLFSPSMDRVFSVLQRDYGAAQVEAAVARQLRTPAHADLANHRTILRLSSRRDGRSRVITTNFDHLFDRADPRQPRFVPPFLPDLQNPEALAGIVYLHGRAIPNAGRTTRQGLVLTSADFGRAYLSDGWATRFMREIMARYTLVLLGYSAEDPPVRYLLEGLNAGGGAAHPIYTFASGAAADVEPQWRARGVRPILYPTVGHDHRHLWESLEVWAGRAADPLAWQAGVVSRAMAGPRALAAHERGQVAAIVQTVSGADAWRRAGPPAEWLCAFDARIRYARPGAGVFDRGAPFDPLAVYGLDDDPPRPPGARHDDKPPGVNLLEPTLAETRGAAFTGPAMQRWTPMAPRLADLAIWIANAIYQPATLWWAGRQTALHPYLQQVISREMSRHVPPEHAALAHRWRLLLECASDVRDPRRDWYGLREAVSRGGWTPTNLRDLADIVRPRLIVDPLFQGRPEPPQTAERLRDLVHFRVKFLDVPTAELDQATSALAPVVAAWRDGLRQGVSLLHDAGPITWRTPTLHPDSRPGERTLRDGASYFSHFALLFDRLADQDAAAAQREMAHWPRDERFFFDKLLIWAWRRSDLAEPAAVAEGVLGLSEDGFWDKGNDRELLWTLRDRWSSLTAGRRQELEARLAAGPPAYATESPEDHRKRAGYDAAVRLGWLQANGCELSADTLSTLPSLRTADAGWSEADDQRADADREGRVGWVRTETDPSQLVGQPLSQILSLADAAGGMDHELFVRAAPFAGLVASQPSRALAALAYEGRHDRVPLPGWRTFLEARDVVLSPRQTAFAAARLSALPASALQDLRFAAAHWVETAAPVLASFNLPLAWRLWDAVFSALVAGGPPATESSIGDSTVGGVSQRLSRRTFEHAINSPVGNLVEGLTSILSARQLPEASGIPADIRQRFDAALAAPGEGADHAVNLLMAQLPWLHYLDPDYARLVLAPLLGVGASTAEPAWSGLLHYPEPLSPSLFSKIKAGFLDAFRVIADWRWSDRHRDMTSILVSLRLGSNPRYLTAREFRTALQLGGPDVCADALSGLSHHFSANDDVDWAVVRRVLREWPKEVRLQTPAVTRMFFNLAIDAGDQFPDAVVTVLPFLQRTDNCDLYMLSLHGLGEDSTPVAQRFPRPSLALTNAVVGDATAPEEIGRVLDAVLDADPNAPLDANWPRLAALAGR
ncbi:SIR2 family protein [Phenylobacterium sp.]|uniref:SIR2 family protein n=1 Tax=Phenylobacterium sp. TaxID=1871053 RepID=UPI003BA9CC27